MPSLASREWGGRAEFPEPSGPTLLPQSLWWRRVPPLNSVTGGGGVGECSWIREPPFDPSRSLCPLVPRTRPPPRSVVTLTFFPCRLALRQRPLPP